MKQPPRRIIGNLDFETALAGRANNRRQAALPVSVLRRISALATLLRAFGREGDHLWTPAVVDSKRLTSVPGVPTPILESGPLEEMEPLAATLAWGETETIQNHRHAGPGLRRSPGPSVGSVEEAIWKRPSSPCEIAAAVNHRGFFAAASRSLGRSLAGATILHSISELEEHLRSGAGTTAHQWVLKAPFSAAGRDRLIGSGDRLADLLKRQANNLFERFSVVLFEPWLDRVADFGCGAIQNEYGCLIVSVHGQEVDRCGRVMRLKVPLHPDDHVGMTLDEFDDLCAAVREVGARLLDQGYTGPFGVDAWRYLDAEGKSRFHALGEINARLTMGFVARVLVDRVKVPLALTEDEQVILHLAWSEENLRGRIVPLFLPHSVDGPGACLEIVDVKDAR